MDTIATYIRVSTEEQSFERQLQGTHKYAQRVFGVDPGAIETYRDKSTGTNTERSGYRELMGGIDSGDVDAVVTHSISRISRSVRDLDRTAERIVDENGAELHIVSEGFQLKPDEDDPYQTALFQSLGVFAELEAKMAQKRAREGIAARQANPEYYHGPAPLGFDKDDGHLVPAENHDRVVEALEMVQKDNLSKRKAAKELNTSRKSIYRALEKPGLYGL